jgi:mannitol/fructose-specific phosphotransferase system IIA component (Ntr-type)
MSILADSLLSKDIHLSLKSSGHQDAIEELLSPLRGDERVKDWEKLRATLTATLPDRGNSIVLPHILLQHGRSESVSDLVIAAGRSKSGIPLPGQEGKADLVFVAAIPGTLNNEYLRILGAISRVCTEGAALSALMESTTQASFLKILEKGCRE